MIRYFEDEKRCKTLLYVIQKIIFLENCNTFAEILNVLFHLKIISKISSLNHLAMKKFEQIFLVFLYDSFKMNARELFMKKLLKIAPLCVKMHPQCYMCKVSLTLQSYYEHATHRVTT